MRGTYTVKFYLTTDMNENDFRDKLDDCLDLNSVDHYEIQEES